MTKWNVLCRVWGGITGSRQSLLKQDGQIRMFDTEAAAREVADELNKYMNDHPPFSPSGRPNASFDYSPIPALSEEVTHGR